MLPTDESLPDDIDALKALVLSGQVELAQGGAELAQRLAQNTILETQVADLTVKVDRYERLVAEFKRMLFGKRSEKLDPDQLDLALEDIEAAIAETQADIEKSDTGEKRKPARNRGALPKHLPRQEVVLEPQETTCSCGACMERIGEDRSERLDVIPAQFKVIVTIRPKYACRDCQTGVVQASAPASNIASRSSFSAPAQSCCCDRMRPTA